MTGLTIVAAEVYHLPLRYQLMAHAPEGHADGTLDHVVIRLETGDGLTGWGEAFGYRAAPMSYAALKHALLPALLGRRADDIANVTTALDQEFHQAGRHGAILFGLSAIDIALWDIAGKRAGKPVADLLGGAKRRAVPAYASLLHMGDRALVAERVGDALAEGYGQIKLHETTYPEIAAARAAMPADMPLMLDVNCTWSPDQAVAWRDRLAPLQPAWLEEPCFPPEDFAALSALRGAGVAIAAGENAGGVEGFARLTGAVDVIQPSVTKVGGLSAMRRILAKADAAAQRAAPHCAYFGPGYWANLQLLSTRDDGSLAEVYFVGGLPDSIYGDGLWPQAGMLSLPPGPGLGIDPDADRVRDLHRAPGD